MSDGFLRDFSKFNESIDLPFFELPKIPDVKLGESYGEKYHLGNNDNIVPAKLPKQIFNLPNLDEIVFELSEPTTDVSNRVETQEEVGENEVDAETTTSYLEGFSEMFELEHELREPPRPVTDRLSLKSMRLVHHYEPLSPLMGEEWTPPTLEERIANLEAIGNYEKRRERERLSSKDLRSRENFGQKFTAAVRFDLSTEDMMTKLHRSTARSHNEELPPKKTDPEKEVMLTNRVSLYRYLQQRGIALIDDTGLSLYAHSSKQHDHEHGFLFLPESIDKEVFYEFEDQIRTVAPFDSHEMSLALLKAELEEGREIDPKQLQIEDKDMRALVDYLATDERFMSMFEQSENLQKARLARRREVPADYKEIETTDDIVC